MIKQILMARCVKVCQSIRSGTFSSSSPPSSFSSSSAIPLPELASRWSCQLTGSKQCWLWKNHGEPTMVVIILLLSSWPKRPASYPRPSTSSYWQVGLDFAFYHSKIFWQFHNNLDNPHLVQVGCITSRKDSHKLKVKQCSDCGGFSSITSPTRPTHPLTFRWGQGQGSISGTRLVYFRDNARWVGQSAEASDSLWTCAASSPWPSPPPPPPPPPPGAHLVHLHLEPPRGLRQRLDILQSATCNSWLHLHLVSYPHRPMRQWISCK